MNGSKVFNLYKGLPLIAMTCGLGNFGSESIATLAKELRYRLTNGDADIGINEENYTVSDVVTRAKKFLFEEKFLALAPLPLDHFEFWIAGYPSDKKGKFELWKIIFHEGKCGDPVRVAAPGVGGLHWGGSVSPITRLVLGFEPATLMQGVTAAIAPLTGADPKAKEEIVNHIVATVKNFSGAQLVSDSMPMQDAIELADFLAHTAKRFFHFSPGADIVGGETDIAVITRYEGFKWITRKHFYPSALNPLETDHV